MQHSTKKIRPLSELSGNRLFVLSKRHANDIDIVTGKSCIFVGVNGQPHYIPVEEPTPIPYDVFCILREIGVMDVYREFNEGDTL